MLESVHEQNMRHALLDLLKKEQEYIQLIGELQAKIRRLSHEFKDLRVELLKEVS